MPWFYFHLRGSKGLEPDDTGLEFAGIEAAYLEAYATIPELSADLASEGKKPGPLCLRDHGSGRRAPDGRALRGDPGARAQTRFTILSSAV
jgi:hypothetical protein